MFPKIECLKEKTAHDRRLFEELNRIENELLLLNEYLESKQKEMEILRLHLNPKDRFGFLFSKNKAMQNLFATAEKHKNSEIPILIVGEKGTGKESLARVIHIRSEKKGPFIVYGGDSSASATSGYAARGYRPRNDAKDATLYFSEVSLTTPHLQKKILDVIPNEATCGGVRDLPRIVISAKQINDLEPEITQKMSFVFLRVPPLRERKEDLLPLIDFFVREFSKNEKNILDFTPSALNKLTEYAWPGNMSELKFEIKRMLADHGNKKIFTLELLPEKIIGSSLKELSSIIKHQKNLPAAVESLERKMVMEALIRHKGNKSKVSRELGISRSGLIQKVQKYGIEFNDRHSLKQNDESAPEIRA